MRVSLDAFKLLESGSLAIAIIQRIRNTCVSVRQSPYLKFDRGGDLGGYNSGIHFLRQSFKKT